MILAWQNVKECCLSFDFAGKDIQTARKNSNDRILARNLDSSDLDKKNTVFIAAMRSTSGKSFYCHPGSKIMVSKMFFREKLFEYLSLICEIFRRTSNGSSLKIVRRLSPPQSSQTATISVDQHSIPKVNLH